MTSSPKRGGGGVGQKMPNDDMMTWKGGRGVKERWHNTLILLMQSTNSKSMSKVISTSIREHLNCREINQGTNICCFVVKPFFSPFTVGGGWMGGAKNDMIRGRRWVWIPLENDLWTIYEQPLIGLQNVPNTKSFLKKRIDIPNYQKLLFSGSSVLRLRGSSAIFSAKQSERTPLQNNYQVPEL